MMKSAVSVAAAALATVAVSNPAMAQEDRAGSIQVKLLGRVRDPELPEAEQERWLEPLLRSINAIASGMRNTG